MGLRDKRADAWRVLYVPTGFGFPYNPGVEQHVIRGLEAVTSNLLVAEGPAPLLEQVSRFRPNLVFTLVGYNLQNSTLNSIRELGCLTAVWSTEDPYYADLAIPRGKAYDLVFTIDANCVSHYRRHGCSNVWHVPLGYDPNTYYPGEVPPQYESDICFVGMAFDNRLDIINQLADYLRGKKVVIIGPRWEKLRRYKDLAHLINNKILSPEETRLYYAGAKIVLNIHRRFDDLANRNRRFKVEAVSPNVRTFEVNACKTMQITDFRPDLPNWYAIDREIVVFSDAADLRRKIDYYLANGKLRQQIAEAGYERSKKHTYAKRLETILNLAQNAPRKPIFAATGAGFEQGQGIWNGWIGNLSIPAGKKKNTVFFPAAERLTWRK